MQILQFKIWKWSLCVWKLVKCTRTRKWNSSREIGVQTWNSVFNLFERSTFTWAQRKRCLKNVSWRISLLKKHSGVKFRPFWVSNVFMKRDICSFPSFLFTQLFDFQKQTRSTKTTENEREKLVKSGWTCREASGATLLKTLGQLGLVVIWYGNTQFRICA